MWIVSRGECRRHSRGLHPGVCIRPSGPSEDAQSKRPALEPFFLKQLRGQPEAESYLRRPRLGPALPARGAMHKIGGNTAPTGWKSLFQAAFELSSSSGAMVLYKIVSRSRSSRVRKRGKDDLIHSRFAGNFASGCALETIPGNTFSAASRMRRRVRSP